MPKFAARLGQPRYEEIDREQLCWRQIDIERLIGAEHPARAVWEFIGQLDLSAYQEEVRAVEGKAGRPGWEPRLLISLWVYAYSQGVGSARAIEELCQWEPAYQWLTGSRVINAHTLSDFRVKRDKALNALFVQSLGLLSAEWCKRAMTSSNWSLGLTECNTTEARPLKRWSPTADLSAEIRSWR